MTEQQQRFFDRAKLGESNPHAVTESLSNDALVVALLEVGQIAEHALFDVAMLRLKVVLKSELSEVDWRLYKAAKSQVGKSTTAAPSSGYAVATRESQWDM